MESQYLREHSRVKRRDKSEVGGDRRQSSEALTNCTHIATNCDYVSVAKAAGVVVEPRLSCISYDTRES